MSNMERQGSDWSDSDASEGGAEGRSSETQSPRSVPPVEAAHSRPPEAEVPEHRKMPPLFDLGIIYNRPAHGEMPPPLVQAEQEPSAPDFMRGVTPGSPAEVAARHAHPDPDVVEIASEFDTDDEDEGGKESDGGTSRVVSDRTDGSESVLPPVEYEPVTLPSFADTFPSAPLESAQSAPPPEASTVAYTEYEPDQPAPPVETAPTTDPSPVTAENHNTWTLTPVQPALEQTPPPTTHVASSGPPLPPIPPQARFAAANYPPPPAGPNMGYANTAPQPAQPNVYAAPSFANMVTKREMDRLLEKERLKRAAQLIMVAAVAWYIGRRPVKPLQERVGVLQEQVKEQEDQITRLTYQQQDTERALASQRQQLEQQRAVVAPQPAERPVSSPARPVNEAAPAQRPAPNPNVIAAPTVPAEQQLKVIGEDGQEIVLKEGERLVPGGEGHYAVVVNKYNQVVHDRIPYGDSLRQDLMPEQIPTPFGTADARFAAGGGSAAGAAGGGGGVASGGLPVLQPGQIPQDRTAPLAHARQSEHKQAQSLLAVPKSNPVLSAITSPWLWLGVGIIMVAFFAAATL